MKEIINNQKLQIILKNGRVYNGKVLDHNEKEIYFLDKFGKKVTIDRVDISVRMEMD